MKDRELALPFLSELQSKVQLTEISLELPKKLSTKQWEDIGRSLGKIQQCTQWWIGDWWAFGEHEYGDRKELVETEEWDGPSFDTCQRAGQIARVFEDKTRRQRLLSFEHHKEVQSLPIDEADRLLDWCQEPLNNGAKKSRTIRELRDEVKKVKAYLAQGWNASQLERKNQVEAGEIVLANMTPGKDGLPIDNALITWAESQDLTVRIDRQTDWGNPYEMDADGSRDEVITWFEEYYPHKRSLHRRMMKDFNGRKVLLCWCYPEPCHGDFYLKQLRSFRAKV